MHMGFSEVGSAGDLASCPARRGQQRSLRSIRHDLSWAFGALARASQPGMSVVGGLLGRGLVPSPVRGADVLAGAGVPLLSASTTSPQSASSRTMPGPGRRSGHERRRAAGRIPR